MPFQSIECCCCCCCCFFGSCFALPLLLLIIAPSQAHHISQATIPVLTCGIYNAGLETCQRAVGMARRAEAYSVQNLCPLLGSYGASFMLPSLRTVCLQNPRLRDRGIYRKGSGAAAASEQCAWYLFQDPPSPMTNLPPSATSTYTAIMAPSVPSPPRYLGREASGEDSGIPAPPLIFHKASSTRSVSTRHLKPVKG